MLKKFSERGLWKLAVYFTYLCGQVLILATLLLTASSMVGHCLMMVLTIALYFLVCLKDPGTYAANQQPNLEDISNSRQQSCLKKKDKKKIVSDKICQYDFCDQIKEQKPIEKEVARKKSEKLSIEEEEDMEKPQRQKCSLQRMPSINAIQEPKVEAKVVASAKLILSAAKNVIGNFTSFMSKKNIESLKQNVDEENSVKPRPFSKSARFIQDDRSISLSIRKIPQPLQEEKQRKQSDREKVVQDQQEKQEKQQQIREEKIFSSKKKVSTLKEHDKVQKDCEKEKTIEEIMHYKRRYCRICEFYQPLRVRHCHSCEVCVSTFDHHCPWLSTCIGQKNKLPFIGYLFAQTFQFLIILIDLSKYLSKDQQGQNSASVGILLFAVVLIFIVLSVLFGFHVYLIVNNITTWQLFRWEKIEYLSVFDKKSLRSPFHQGWKLNIQTMWEISFEKEPKKWEQSLSKDLDKCLVKDQKNEHEPGTERKMCLRQGNN